MKTDRSRPSSRRWLDAACALVALALAAPAAAQHVWLDAAKAPLPFQTHREITEYLGAAEVVDRKPIGVGITGAERLVLERGGVRLRAAFRTVDETERGPFEGLPTSLRRVRDAAVFECAAYELSEALGLGRVPPTVCRKVDGKPGSLQIWFEGAMTETDLAEKSLDPPDLTRWGLQKQDMYVFDALVANLDRNRGNVMIAPDWTLWFIDHTRAFAQTSELLGKKKITRCSRDLWRALRELDPDALSARLAPYLDRGETAALLKRRTALVAHIEALIAARGEAAVLFDLAPPAAEPAARPPSTAAPAPPPPGA